MVTYQNEHMHFEVTGFKRECHFQSATVWLVCLHPFNSFPPSTTDRLMAGQRTAVAMVTDTNKNQQWVTWPRLSMSLFSICPWTTILYQGEIWNERDRQKRGCSPHCYLKYFSEKEVLSAHILKCIYFYSRLIEITQLCRLAASLTYTPSRLQPTGRTFQICICNNRTETAVELLSVINLHTGIHTQIEKLPINLNLHGLVHQALAFFTHQGCNGSPVSFNGFM